MDSCKRFAVHRVTSITSNHIRLTNEHDKRTCPLWLRWLRNRTYEPSHKCWSDLQVLFTPMCLCHQALNFKQYNLVLVEGRWSLAGKVTTDLEKVMAAYRRGWLKSSPVGRLSVHRDQLQFKRSVTSMRELCLLGWCYNWRWEQMLILFTSCENDGQFVRVMWFDLQICI